MKNKLFLSASAALLLAFGGFLAASSPAGTASAADVPTATPAPYVPIQRGLKPGHSCDVSLRSLQVGDSANCLIRVKNYGPAAADDVVARFSNTNLTVSNVAIRVGSYGAYTPVVGGTNTLSIIAPPTDVPAGSGLYITFTVTRSDMSQGAPRYPIVCADAANFPEVCSQSGVS